MSVRTMFALDIFEGDVYRAPRSGLGGNPASFFVWSVDEDGTVEFSEFYNTYRQPKRFKVSPAALAADYVLLEKNPAPRLSWRNRL